jgi:DNA helicase-4
VEDTSRALLQKLSNRLNHWDKYRDYYFQKFLPAIVRDDPSEKLEPTERMIVDALRSLLSAEEWIQLPELIAQCKDGTLGELESDTRRALARTARLREEAQELQRQQAGRVERDRREAAEQRRQMAELDLKRRRLVERLAAAFEENFLEADRHFREDPDRALLGDKQYQSQKVAFIQQWAKQVLGEALDPEQAAAVGAVEGDVRVVARAGSGKTRALVARALFLQRHCGVLPGQLLLLAFNRKAAEDIKEKINEKLTKAHAGALPHVMTFHALAHALVHPEEDLLYDDSGGGLSLSRVIQSVIDEHLKSSRYRPVIRDLMLSHFREDWERIVEGGFHLPLAELVQYRRALPRETLRGEYVKSFGERLIANTLFEHDIEYHYERNFRWNGTNYRPDFTILRSDGSGVIIEYFGLEGDADYDRMSQQKRAFWAGNPRWKFLEFSPGEIAAAGAETFPTLLLSRLGSVGIVGRPLPEEEIWERIRKRAVDRFTSAVRSFVSRCRKRNIGDEELQALIDGHSPINEAEASFLQVVWSVVADYRRHLKTTKQDDFDGLMWTAISFLGEGKSAFVRDRGRERGDLRNLRFVLVDEFQDFSEVFFRFFQALRLLNPAVTFFGVGDDWQSINGFAGSDLRYFEDFSQYFRQPTTLHVATNYRSPASIVEVGNALMHGRGEPARPDANRQKAGWVRTARLDDFRPTTIERERHGGDEATPALLRLVRRFLDSGREVVMLSRRNDAPWYLNYAPDERAGSHGLQRLVEHLRRFLPDPDGRRVSASTTHQFKGAQKEAVIILDADQGSYPLIHPNWIFLRLFGDSVDRIEAEERRLFYVALTRAQHSLVILSCDSWRGSPYLVEIGQHMHLAAIDWSKLPPAPSLDGARLEVRVFGFKVKDLLKKLGYHWRDSSKCWARSVMAEGFDVEMLCRQPWAIEGVRIEIWSEGGDLILTRACSGPSSLD